MDDQTQRSVARLDPFSEALMSEFHTYFKDQYGRDLTKLQVEDACLKIAEFVFRKEKKKADAIPTI